MADKTDKKPGFVARAVWPSKEDTRKNTTVVLVVVLIAAAVLFVLDAIFGGILGLIIGG